MVRRKLKRVGNKFVLIQAKQPTRFKKNIYSVEFARKGKPLVDKNIRFTMVKAKSRSMAIKRARKKLMLK